MTTQTPIKRGAARRLGLVQPVPFTWVAFHESVADFGEKMRRLAGAGRPMVWYVGEDRP